MIHYSSGVENHEVAIEYQCDEDGCSFDGTVEVTASRYIAWGVCPGCLSNFEVSSDEVW